MFDSNEKCVKHKKAHVYKSFKKMLHIFVICMGNWSVINQHAWYASGPLWQTVIGPVGV